MRDGLMLTLEAADLGRQRGCPRGDGVELEAQTGIPREPVAERPRGRRVAEAEGVDEAHGPRLQFEDVVQRAAGLAQGEIQRRRFVRPVAVLPRGLPHGRRRPLLEGREVLTEALQRPLAGQRQRGKGIALVGKGQISSPRPSVPAPSRRICVVVRSTADGRSASSRSNSQASTTSESSPSRGHSPATPGGEAICVLAG
jgi:hypothetical protein